MIPSSLTQQPGPLYLLSSDEPLLVREWLDSARKNLHAQGFEEIVTHQVETGFDWDGLIEQSQTLSLFSERKAHIVRFNSVRPGQAGSKFISHIAEQSPEDTVFILVMPKLDQASKNAAWMKKLRQQGEVCELKPVYTNELPGWISQRAMQKGIHLDMPSAQFLADLTEGNLLATDQELEKLALACEPGTSLDLEHISEKIARSARYTHYLLIDACLAGNIQRAHQILLSLRQEGVQPVQILFSLQSALENLWQLKQAQQHNQLNNSVWQALRIWQAKQRFYAKALSRMSLIHIERYLRSCAKLDRINKGQVFPRYPDDDWQQMQRLVAGFSGI